LLHGHLPASVLDALVKIASCLDFFFELDSSFVVCPGFTKVLGPSLTINVDEICDILVVECKMVYWTDLARSMIRYYGGVPT
jgi:hypothetical protein